MDLAIATAIGLREVIVSELLVTHCKYYPEKKWIVTTSCKYESSDNMVIQG